MKKYLIINILLLIIGTCNFNDLKAMDGKDSLKTYEKMTEEIMKQLSPEEQKQFQDAMELAKDMKDKGITGNVTTGDGLSIPQRQDKILSEVPTLSSPQQYNDYLSSLISKCKNNIEPSIIAEVDELISKNSNNTGTLVNLGTILLMQKKPVAAIYAAIKTAMAKPEIILLQNNMAVILHQTGNPQISLPILQYLLIRNNNSLILNNLAQSYLSLGDTTNAGMYFRACLQKDPDDCEANCGMGLLLSEEGNIVEATPYIKKSLKNGYSETADEILKKNKMDIKFSDIKQEVPEYFNPQKFKPVPPAYTMENVEPTLALRKEFEDYMRLWMQKKEQVNNEQNNKMGNESLIQMADRNRGYLSNTPFAKKSQLMLNLIGIEYSEFVAKDFKNQYLPIQKEYYSELEKLSFQAGYDNDGCKKQIGFLNNYLQKSAKNHEDYQRNTLPKQYEWANQSLYWWFFLSNEEQYKMYYTNYVSDFFEAIHGYDEMQTLTAQPEYIANHCKDVKEPTKEKIMKDSIPSPVCPVKIAVPLGAGKVKWDCNGYEIEGGELIMGGFEKDYKTGQMTLFVGLGAELFGKGTFIGGVEGGIKVGSFVKLGSDFTILDLGNKGEAGIEGGIGPYVTEGKVTGIMGMKSGITIDKTIMGEQKNIYKSDPAEVKINPEINIFK